MTDAWAQAEAERIMSGLIGIGTVSAVDAVARRAKLKRGALETDWQPWTVHRAGSTRTASAPSVGEQRLLFSPYGDSAQGVIGPAIYQDDFDAPTDSATQEVVEFSDGSRVEYDTDTSTLTVNVGSGAVIVNCQVATVAASGSVTLDTPTTHCTGALVVDGDATFNGGAVTHGGKNIGKTHTHGGVQAGAGTTGAPT